MLIADRQTLARLDLRLSVTIDGIYGATLPELELSELRLSELGLSELELSE